MATSARLQALNSRQKPAHDTLGKAARAAPGPLACSALLGHVHARAGNTQAALQQLDELRGLAERRYVPAFLFALVYVGLGEHDKAVSLMIKEYEARGWYLLLIRHGPQFDPLRGTPVSRTSCVG